MYFVKFVFIYVIVMFVCNSFFFCFKHKPSYEMLISDWSSDVCSSDLMAISHVIRGEDHLSNTPKHIALIRALGYREPLFGHIPLILNPDRSKMSKRKSQTAITAYREQGYLPEAMVNFLAFLG